MVIIMIVAGCSELRADITVIPRAWFKQDLITDIRADSYYLGREYFEKMRDYESLEPLNDSAKKVFIGEFSQLLPKYISLEEKIDEKIDYIKRRKKKHKLNNVPVKGLGFTYEKIPYSKLLVDLYKFKKEVSEKRHNIELTLDYLNGGEYVEIAKARENSITIIKYFSIPLVIMIIIVYVMLRKIRQASS